MNNKYGLLFAMAGIFSQSQASSINSDQSEKALIQPLQQTISHAITQFEQTPRGDWSYRVTRYENEEGDVTSSIERYDPIKDRDSQWTLLRINGQTPSSKQAAKFSSSKLKQADADNQQSVSIKLREIIQLDSLQLISEDQTRLQAGFDVYLSRLGKEATENLAGSLTFNKQEQFIETIEITNTDDFSPVFSADITDFKLTFRFIKINSAILPQQQELSMKGTFAFFTEIEEVSKDTFSEYRYVGQ